MGNLVPQIWADVLVASHLSRANALHHSLQQKWAVGMREYLQGELDYALISLRSLGKRPLLRDGVYQLEE